MLSLINPEITNGYKPKNTTHRCGRCNEEETCLPFLETKLSQFQSRLSCLEQMLRSQLCQCVFSYLEKNVSFSFIKDDLLLTKYTLLACINDRIYLLDMINLVMIKNELPGQKLTLIFHRKHLHFRILAEPEHRVKSILGSKVPRGLVFAFRLCGYRDSFWPSLLQYVKRIAVECLIFRDAKTVMYSFLL